MIRPKDEIACGPVRGRGASSNPFNRFEEMGLKKDLDAWVDADEPSPTTRFFIARPRTALTTNDSPDTPDVTLNPYRGCEHGCIYCYARPTHETLGLSAGLDFETKLFVKQGLPELLRKELSSPNWRPQVVSMSGITDCYQPIEKKFELTRACLKVLLEFRNPVFIVTKNFLVTRDIDILSELARHNAAAVFLSVTTLDRELARVMEPRTALPELRLEAVRKLSDANIPVGVNVAPVIPGLTDHEMPKILEAAAQAGARYAGYTMLRLPYAVKELFEKWIEERFPDRKEKILNRIRSIRGGKLNDPGFHSRMWGHGIFAEQVADLFSVSCRRWGIGKHALELSTAGFRRSGGNDLFE